MIDARGVLRPTPIWAHLTKQGPPSKDPATTAMKIELFRYTNAGVGCASFRNDSTPQKKTPNESHSNVFEE